MTEIDVDVAKWKVMQQWRNLIADAESLATSRGGLQPKGPRTPSPGSSSAQRMNTVETLMHDLMNEVCCCWLFGKRRTHRS